MRDAVAACYRLDSSPETSKCSQLNCSCLDATVLNVTVVDVTVIYVTVKMQLTTDCADAAGACTVALCSISSAALVNVRCIRLVRRVLLLLLIVGLLLPL
jgi:hypothetical protein